MITSLKHWHSIVHKNTGEPLGIMCYECFEPVKDHLHFQEGVPLENIKDNLFMECMSCRRMVNEDYVTKDGVNYEHK